MDLKSLKVFLIVSFLILSCASPKKSVVTSNLTSIDKKVDSLLQIMTLEEKIGQLNQYNGFWEITGPAPKEGQAAKKYNDLKKGLSVRC
jgi:beta-glucosidase